MRHRSRWMDGLREGAQGSSDLQEGSGCWIQSWHITDLLAYKFHPASPYLNLNALICATEWTKMRACMSLRVICVCVCVCQAGPIPQHWEAGRHDALWVAAPLRGWPDLCLQLRFTGQQQIGGVIAWQQHSPSLGLTAHSKHTHKHAHAGSTKCMVLRSVGRRKHGSWGNSWNTKCTQMLAHAQIPRGKKLLWSITLFREQVAFV